MLRLLSHTMATRPASDAAVDRRERCTEFQVFAGSQHPDVIDFTERKLLQYADRVQDAQQRSMILAVIEDYRRGSIAVAWSGGRPIHIKVTRGA